MINTEQAIEMAWDADADRTMHDDGFRIDDDKLTALCNLAYQKGLEDAAEVCEGWKGHPRASWKIHEEILSLRHEPNLLERAMIGDSVAMSVDTLEVRVRQFDRAIRRIATHVGACCAGVDVEDDNGRGSHTDQEIIRKIDQFRTASAQATIARLREAFWRLVELNSDGEDALDRPLWIREALAMPQDDQCLFEFGMKVIETWVARRVQVAELTDEAIVREVMGK